MTTQRWRESLHPHFLVVVSVSLQPIPELDTGAFEHVVLSHIRDGSRVREDGFAGHTGSGSLERGKRSS